MEFEKISESQLEDNSLDSNINIKDIIIKYLRSWKWFLLSIIICLLVAYYQLNFIRPQYKAIATIKMKNENAGDQSMLSVFQDLNVPGGSNNNIQDEIEIFKSKGLFAQVIKELGLNVQYFDNKNFISEFLDNKLGFQTEFYENEKYKNSPIKINFFISDSILYKTSAKFLISIKSTDHFVMIERKKNMLSEKESKQILETF